VIWGEPDGYLQAGVERHVQAEIRATVSTTPVDLAAATSKRKPKSDQLSLGS